MSTSHKLGAGDVFPTLKFTEVGGKEFSLPTDIGSSHAIILFYRGHW